MTRKRILTGAGIVAALLVACTLVLPSIFRGLTFMDRPLTEAEGDPAYWGFADMEAIRIKTTDGVTLHGWWAPARTESGLACGTLIYFHGNAGNVASRGTIARTLARRGVNALVVDYRGYGLSEGESSAAGLYRDGEAMYRYVHEERGVPANRILLMGHSLGTAVATRVAAEHAAAGLVLSAPFTSFAGAIDARAPWIPIAVLSWALPDFGSGSRISRITEPVLMAIGSDDGLVPRVDARALFDAANDPKRWFLARGGGHNFVFSHDAFWRELDRFLWDTLGCVTGGYPIPGSG